MPWLVEASSGGAWLVGRRVEVDLIQKRLVGVMAGRGAVVWIEGEPGIGKSALLQAVASAGAGMGVRVFIGSGDELTQRFELRLMADCLGVDASSDDPLRRDIAQLLAGRGGGVNAVSAASVRMLELVDAECARSPVALIVDDLQWADEATLGVWRRLAAVTDQLPLLLVSACRPVPQRGEVGALERALADQANADRVDLGGLAAGDVDRMAAGLLAAQPGPRLARILAQAAGNPLYIREIIDVLTGEGVLGKHDGVAELADGYEHELATVGAAITRRLGFLPEPARAVLRAAATLGGRFTLQDLGLVSHRSVPDLLDVVGQALVAGVLAETGTELTFRHPLIRQALYDELPSAVRTGLHAHAANEVASRGASWDKVARHLIAASGGVDAWVVDWLANLPGSALYARPAIAADVLERARDAAPPGDPRRYVLIARLTTVLRLQARQDELISQAAAVLPRLTDPQLIGEVAWNLARGLNMAGRHDDQDAVITDVIDNRAPAVPWRSRLRALRGPALFFLGQRDEAIRQCELAIAEGEQDNDPVTVGWAMVGLRVTAPDYHTALAHIDRGLAAVTGDDPDAVDVRHLLVANRLSTLGNANQLDEFDATLRQALDLMEPSGANRLHQVQTSAALQYLDRGEWDEALLYFDQISEATVNALDVLRFRGSRAYLAVCRGDRAGAERHIAAVAGITYAEPQLSFAAYRLIHARALLAEADGRLGKALGLLTDWLDPRYANRAQHGRPEILRELVRVALAADDWDTAQAAAAAAMSDATASQDDRDLVEARCCQAMLDDDPAPLLATATYMAERGRVLEHASLLQEAAVRLAVGGQNTRARAALIEAARLYVSMGNVLDLARMQARLRPHGVRLGPRSLHKRASVGWEALTPAERTVVTHIADGRSNAEIAGALFLSRRTVQTHVSHILAKLEVSNRIDIALSAAQHAASGARA